MIKGGERVTAVTGLILQIIYMLFNSEFENLNLGTCLVFFSKRNVQGHFFTDLPA